MFMISFVKSLFNYIELTTNEKEFIEAAKKGNTKKLKSIIRANGKHNINAHNGDGKTALFFAIQNGYLDTVKYLTSFKKIKLAFEASVSQYSRTPHYTSALFVAVENKHNHIVDYLLASLSEHNLYFDPNEGQESSSGDRSYGTFSSFSQSPLYIACSNNDNAIVKTLLSCPEVDSTIGAHYYDCSIGGDGERHTIDTDTMPLNLACSKDFLEIIKLLKMPRELIKEPILKCETKEASSTISFSAKSDEKQIPARGSLPTQSIEDAKNSNPSSSISIITNERGPGIFQSATASAFSSTAASHRKKLIDCEEMQKQTPTSDHPVISIT
jgi:ankyrin repeat protein